jgi:hypothetical protein
LRVLVSRLRAIVGPEHVLRTDAGYGLGDWLDLVALEQLGAQAAVDRAGAVLDVGSGTVHVAWADCRFRRSCKTNDRVVSHSLNSAGIRWSTVSRVPIDATSTGIDHFIPGPAVNKARGYGAA